MKILRSAKWNIDIKETIKRNSLLFAFIILCFFSGNFAPGFLKIGNITNIIRTGSIHGLVALGATLVILTGDIDLSVSGTIVFTGAIGASLSYTPGLAFTLPVVIGLAAGLIIGLIRTGFKVQSFIITLGMAGVLKGAALIYLDGGVIYDLSEQYRYVGAGDLLGIPVPIWFFAIVFIALYIVMNKSKLGRYIYAVGSNPEASRLSGINTRLVRISTFVISGGLAGLAGILVTSRIAAAEPTVGDSWEFDAVTAVVIGGTSLMGGQGSIFSTLIGIFVLQVINNGMTLVGVPSFWIQLVRGIVIILAVISDRKNESN